MPAISPADPDHRIFLISFATLLEIQREAEARGFATRWTSVAALRDQVAEQSVLLRSLLREERAGTLRAYRCLGLLSLVDGGSGLVTVDLDPARFASLDRLDRDADVRAGFARMFAIALGGVPTIAKS